MNKMLADIITLHSPFSKEKRPDVSIVFDVGEKKTVPTFFSVRRLVRLASVANLTFELKQKRIARECLWQFGVCCVEWMRSASVAFQIILFEISCFRKMKNNYLKNEIDQFITRAHLSKQKRIKICNSPQPARKWWCQRDDIFFFSISRGGTSDCSFRTENSFFSTICHRHFFRPLSFCTASEYKQHGFR